MAVARHVPRVAGRLGLVDHQQPGGALPHGLGILVVPATVVGHRVAGEQLRILRRVARVVDQRQHQLAAHVEARVVVPAVLGRDDAVTREHDAGVLERRLRHRAPRPCHQVVRIAQLERLAGRAPHLHHRVRVRLDLRPAARPAGSCRHCPARARRPGTAARGRRGSSSRPRCRARGPRRRRRRALRCACGTRLRGRPASRRGRLESQRASAVSTAAMRRPYCRRRPCVTGRGRGL